MRVLWFLLLPDRNKDKGLGDSFCLHCVGNSKKVNENIRKITQAKSQLEGGLCCLW